MAKSKETIPKIIHYCWFGNKEKPPLVQKCIQSWRDCLKDYEIIEWNESNTSLESNQYVKEAYKQEQYAFVSDYVRMQALYNMGGIYLDTDVEVFKSFNNLLINQSFFGFEEKSFVATSTFGAMKEHPIIKNMLDYYDGQSFIQKDGSYNQLTNVAVMTKMFEKIGMKRTGEQQYIEEMAVIYPQSYFSPYDYINCRLLQTEETYAVHHFYKSWLSPRQKAKGMAKQAVVKLIGGNNLAYIRSIITKGS